MSKGRLEAFSDGVIAIIITIMVLELTPPHEATLGALRPLIPTFLSYVLSYVFLGIYWSNHHHLLQAIKHVDGRVLWANLHLLLWLSLVPFVTAWMGENHFQAWPVALYGIVMFFAGDRVFHSREMSRLSARPGLGPGDGRRAGYQRQDLAGDLPGGDSTRLCERGAGVRAVCPGGGDVARAGSADRENAASVDRDQESGSGNHGRLHGTDGDQVRTR